jgi:hypothetical protein
MNVHLIIRIKTQLTQSKWCKQIIPTTASTIKHEKPAAKLKQQTQPNRHINYKHNRTKHPEIRNSQISLTAPHPQHIRSLITVDCWKQYFFWKFLHSTSLVYGVHTCTAYFCFSWNFHVSDLWVVVFCWHQLRACWFYIKLASIKRSWWQKFSH